MFSLFSTFQGLGGNGAKAYQCIGCSGLITHSDQLLRMGTSNRHLFVNPAGIQCDFYTFSSCQGAVAHGPATEADTWFPGYRWRMAFCRHCGQHLGWHYEAVSPLERPSEFWGILVTYLHSV